MDVLCTFISLYNKLNSWQEWRGCQQCSPWHIQCNCHCITQSQYITDTKPTWT